MLHTNCYYESRAGSLSDGMIGGVKGFFVCIHLSDSLTESVPQKNREFTVSTMLFFDYFLSYAYVGGFSSGYHQIS